MTAGLWRPAPYQDSYLQERPQRRAVRTGTSHTRMDLRRQPDSSTWRAARTMPSRLPPTEVPGSGDERAAFDPGDNELGQPADVHEDSDRQGAGDGTRRRLLRAKGQHETKGQIVVNTQTAQPAGSPVIEYLAVLPTAQRRELLDLAREVTARCEDWLRVYPIVLRPSVTAACSLISAVALPGAAPAELRVLTCWWLWIFGVDDVFDDPAADDSQIACWAGRFASDPPIDPADDDPLRAALGSIHDALSRYPLFARLASQWRTGMAEIVSGMLTERQWSVSTPPTFPAYLANGMATIAVRPYTLTACVLAGERGAAAAFETLDPVINAAARCFRLANDLRSDSRERQEGKLNALTVLGAEYSARGLRDNQALRAARRRLYDTCVADLEYLDRARRAAPPAIATLAGFLWAHTAFVWDMYHVGDYDTVSTLLREGGIS